VGSTRYTLAHQVHAMAHIVQIVYTRNLLHMGFIVHKIWIGLDGSLNRLEVGTFFQLHIHHTAMNARTCRNSHGQCILHTIDGTHSYRVSHASARTKVRISDTLRSDGFKQRTHHRITARIPTCRDNGYRTILFSCLTQRTSERSNLCMYIKTINGVDSQSQNLLGLHFYLTGRTCHDGYIHILQFGNILHHFVISQFCRLVFRAVTTDDACYFKIRSSLKRFHNRFTNVTVTYYGRSNLFHLRICFNYLFQINGHKNRHFVLYLYKYSAIIFNFVGEK